MMSHEAEELLLRLESTLDLDEAVAEARVDVHNVRAVSNNNNQLNRNGF